MKIQKELRFTFFSAGTPHQFKALKESYDPMTKSRRTQLDIHRDLVRQANRPDVFILDQTGKVLEIR